MAHKFTVIMKLRARIRKSLTNDGLDILNDVKIDLKRIDCPSSSFKTISDQYYKTPTT